MLRPFNLIIAAGGTGSRMQSTLPKQFFEIEEKTILEHSILAFKWFKPAIIVVAVHYDYLAETEQRLKRLNLPIKCVAGGSTRKESVEQALACCDIALPTLIHDAARPCVTTAIIEAVLNGLNSHCCVIPGIPVTDTIKSVSNNMVNKTVDRSKIQRIQTPQGFDTSILIKALNLKSDTQVTDEALLIEQLGHDILVVPGADKNIKATVSQDWVLIKHYLLSDHRSN